MKEQVLIKLVFYYISIFCRIFLVFQSPNSLNKKIKYRVVLHQQFDCQNYVENVQDLILHKK